MYYRSAQRNPMNNLASTKVNYMEIGPKTNKVESFPSLYKKTKI